MGGPATRRFRAGGIDGGTPLLDISDLAFFIHYKGRPVGNARRLDQHAIGGRHLAFREVTEQREGCVGLGGELFLGWSIVGADSKNLGIRCIEFSNTSLVCRDFLGSATGESGRKKCQDHGVLAAIVGELHLFAGSGGEGEIRGHVTNLEAGVRRLHLLLGKQAGREECASQIGRAHV